MPYELAGKTIKLVVDPHAGVVVGVEDDDGQSLGAATRLDTTANLNRVRRKPAPPVRKARSRTGPNLVEQVHKQYYKLEEQ